MESKDYKLICIILFILLLNSYAEKFGVERVMKEKQLMYVCYEAGANNYFPLIREYKCSFVPRGKGY